VGPTSILANDPPSCQRPTGVNKEASIPVNRTVVPTG